MWLEFSTFAFSFYPFEFYTLGKITKIPGHMFLSQVMAELLQKGLGPGEIQKSKYLRFMNSYYRQGTEDASNG